MRSIGVLTVDKLVSRGNKEVRIAKTLHDKYRLAVAGDTLLR